MSRVHLNTDKIHNISIDFCQELRNTEFPQDVLKDIFNKLEKFTSSLKRDSDKIKDLNEIETKTNDLS